MCFIRLLFSSDLNSCFTLFFSSLVSLPIITDIFFIMKELIINNLSLSINILRTLVCKSYEKIQREMNNYFNINL